MKKLLLLLALISTFAFGIDKKTPTGGTIKDKPGQSQTISSPKPLGSSYAGTGGFIQSFRTTTVSENFAKVVVSASLNKGFYIASYYVKGMTDTSGIFDNFLRIGGTTVVPNINTNIYSGVYFTVGRYGIPLTITSDGTLVEVITGLNSSWTHSSALNELYIIQLGR